MGGVAEGAGPDADRSGHPVRRGGGGGERSHDTVLLHLSWSTFDQGGVGTVLGPSGGCRGVKGPVPHPLWMNPLSLTGRERSSHAPVQMMGAASSIWDSSCGYRIAMAVTPRRPLPRRHQLRRLGNLVNLSTPLGLGVARVGGATVRSGPRGLLLGEGYRLPFPVAAAFTVGDVLISPRSWDELERSRPGLLAHEEAHAWQWFWCGGLPFLPAYGLCLVWSLLRTGDLAAANAFERRAGLAAGGYPEVLPRRILTVLVSLRRPVSDAPRP